MKEESLKLNHPAACNDYLHLDEENADVSLWCEKEQNHAKYPGCPDDNYHEVRCMDKRDGRIYTTVVKWWTWQSWGVKEGERDAS